jgi:hypothetical protein
VIVDANIAAGAAIQKSKLASLAIVNADVAAGAAIDYAKLALTGSVVNGDIAAAAAIVGSKLNAVRVATTVGGLGTAADGALGLVRAGSTPFDAIALVYDATYGHWVSEVRECGVVTGATGVSSNSTSDVAIGCNVTGPYGNLVTAGLTFQSRCYGYLTETGTGETGSVSMQVATQAAHASVGATGAFTTAYGTDSGIPATSSGNPFQFDTGWASPGAAPTSAAYFALRMVAHTSGTANAKQWFGQLAVRWIG